MRERIHGSLKGRIKQLLCNVGFHMIRPHLPTQADALTSASAKAAMVGTMLDLQARARASEHTLPRLCDSGFRIFSQFEEDGYLIYLAAVLELYPKLFLDIGAADGINSNCANLALNLGWHGLFIDADPGNVARGRAFYATHSDTSLYPPIFKQAFVTAENINELVREAGLSGDIGICSIDIDGNDCWVWKALDAVSPTVVIIETHTEFGMQNLAVPYDPDYRYPGKHPDYFGASPVAMHKLAGQKGYRLVGANRFGFNLIFVRKDVYPERVPEVPLESVLQHARYAERLKLYEPIKDWEYVAL
jgi:hypothetical protein